MDNENFNFIEKFVVFLNYLENFDIIDLNVENLVELYILDYLEEKIFLWFFFYGINGYNIDRIRRLILG